jgi:hypothetical protein
MRGTQSASQLYVIATGRIAPYASGELVEVIKSTKTAIMAAIKAGHHVIDGSKRRVSLDAGQVVRWTR